MNPADVLKDSMIRPPLPGENWDMTEKEAHCFDWELRRLHPDVETPAVSHWIAFIRKALESGKSKTNSTPDLFSYVHGMYPPALAHLVALQPQDPRVWREVLESEYLREEHGITPEEAEARLEDAEAKVFRIPSCGHLAMEHAALIDAWYVRNIADTEHRRATLYRVWRLPAEEVLYGKQFIARYDMDREIQERIDASNRFAETHEDMDPETRSQLVMDLGKTPDEADEILAEMKETRSRDMRAQLLEQYEQSYRIIK